MLHQDNPELLTPIDYEKIRSLTAKMHQQISSGTLDAPSWRLIRNAKLATNIYAPLGTEMSLGDYVRVTRVFLEAFKAAEAERAKLSFRVENSDFLTLHNAFASWRRASGNGRPTAARRCSPRPPASRPSAGRFRMTSSR